MPHWISVIEKWKRLIITIDRLIFSDHDYGPKLYIVKAAYPIGRL